MTHNFHPAEHIQVSEEERGQADFAIFLAGAWFFIPLGIIMGVAGTLLIVTTL